jgi:hypothetical protein
VEQVATERPETKESKQERTERVAGDIVAKALVTGTAGGVYVDRSLAKQAFDGEDTAVFDDALDLLHREGFVFFDKGKGRQQCYGVVSKRWQDAADFALFHASPKRRDRLQAFIDGRAGGGNGAAEPPVDPQPPKPDLVDALAGYTPLPIFRDEVKKLRGEINAARLPYDLEKRIEAAEAAAGQGDWAGRVDAVEQKAATLVVLAKRVELLEKTVDERTTLLGTRVVGLLDDVGQMKQTVAGLESIRFTAALLMHLVADPQRAQRELLDEITKDDVGPGLLREIEKVLGDVAKAGKEAKKR